MCIMPQRELSNQTWGCPLKGFINLTDGNEGCRVLRDLTTEGEETVDKNCVRKGSSATG